MLLYVFLKRWLEHVLTVSYPVPIDKARYLRKGRFYLKCQDGGGNLIAENLPTSEQRIPAGWKEWDWHRGMISISHYRVKEDIVCVTVGMSGRRGFVFPYRPSLSHQGGALVPGTHFCHWKVALGPLQCPGWKCWTELWLWAPKWRICRDALSGKLVSFKVEILLRKRFL